MAARSNVSTEEELAEHHLWELWKQLQALSEHPSKRVPTNSIRKHESFEWMEGTKHIALQGVLVSMIARLLEAQGFKSSTFDSADLNHQYVNRKKKLVVSLHAGRLGVTVSAWATG